MTRDDVIRMAREAGIVTGENLKFSEGYRYRSVGSPTNVREQCLLDFAELVVAAEREACAKLADDMAGRCLHPDEIAEHIRAKGVQRCAACGYQHGHAIGCENNPVDIALRARGIP